MDFRMSIVGLLVGFLIGLTGIGGGSLLAPILIVFFHVPPIWTVATDITYASLTKALGSFVHMRQKHVDLRVAFWLACGSVPAVISSVFLVQYVRKHYDALLNGLILHAIGITLMLVALFMVFKPLLMARLARRKPVETTRQSQRQERYRKLATVLVGAFVGILVGMTSVGSGTLIIVVMAFLYPELTSKELVGTDIFQGFLLLLAGAMGYLYSGAVNWPLVGLLLAGSLPGVYLGSRMSQFIPQRYLAPIVALSLALSGLKLL
jgi:uncharacterized membrane protein YfcA